MASDATLVPIGAKDIDAMVAFAREKGIDFVVVAPDDPLALGAVDALKQAGIACFGPDKKAAEIESSKVFAKRLMKKYGIPTAPFEVLDDEAQALAYLDTAPIPTVSKADGLAPVSYTHLDVYKRQPVPRCRLSASQSNPPR